MAKHEHRRFRPSSPVSPFDGNAWDEVRVTSMPLDLLSAPLTSSRDWLDGELGAFGAGVSRVDH